MNIVKNEYRLVDKIELGWYLFRTKLIDRRVRLFRFPLIIRGQRYIDFGEGLTTGHGCRFDCYAGDCPRVTKLRFGKNVQINDYVHIVAMYNITIGDNVLMASHVFISDNSHGSYHGDNLDSSPSIPPIERDYYTAPISIGKNVWIGEGVIIMPGVTIGEGSVIGAHTIVNKNVPKYSIAVGSPMKILKKYNFETNHWEKIK